MSAIISCLGGPMVKVCCTHVAVGMINFCIPWYHQCPVASVVVAGRCVGKASTQEKASCVIFDRDGDGDVDLKDYHLFITRESQCQ